MIPQRELLSDATRNLVNYNTQFVLCFEKHYYLTVGKV